MKINQTHFVLTFRLVFQHYDNLLNLGYKNVDCRVYVDTNHPALLKLPSNKTCKYEILPGFYFWIKIELMLKSNYFILITELVGVGSLQIFLQHIS